MAVEAPSILELEQVCDFASTRLEQIGEGVANGYSEPLGEWEAECLPKTLAWLQQMQSIEKSVEERTKLATAQLNDDNYGVETMLVISTGHVTGDTANALDNVTTDFGFAIFPKGDHGWMIHIPAEANPEEEAPDELDALIAHCRKLGINWLCLDRDAAEHPEFTIFDW